MGTSVGKLGAPVELAVHPEGAIIDRAGVKELVQRAINGEKVELFFAWDHGLAACLIDPDAAFDDDYLIGLTILHTEGDVGVRVGATLCKVRLSDFNCPPDGIDETSHIFKNYWLAYGHYVRLQKCKST